MDFAYDSLHWRNPNGEQEAWKRYIYDIKKLSHCIDFRYFVVFRNGSQDERLDKKTRLHLLELIELRAKLWQGSNYMSQYYRHRGTHAEVSNA